MATPKDPKTEKIARYLGLAHGAEGQLAEALTKLAERHEGEPDVASMLTRFAKWTRARIDALARITAEASEDPERLRAALYDGEREGGIGLVRDLHDLIVQTTAARMTYQVVEQAAKALRDKDLEALAIASGSDLERMAKWAKTKLKQAAPQALVVPSEPAAGTPTPAARRARASSRS